MARPSFIGLFGDATARCSSDRPCSVSAGGMVGLCPGPAFKNLATLSPHVIVFAAAMTIGMVLNDFWQAQRRARTELATWGATDGAARSESG